MLEIKNEISDTINKITEHLEFLGYKIEKDKEDKELLLAYHDTNNNIYNSDKNTTQNTIKRICDVCKVETEANYKGYALHVIQNHNPYVLEDKWGQIHNRIHSKRWNFRNQKMRYLQSQHFLGCKRLYCTHSKIPFKFN